MKKRLKIFYGGGKKNNVQNEIARNKTRWRGDKTCEVTKEKSLRLAEVESQASSLFSFLSGAFLATRQTLLAISSITRAKSPTKVSRRGGEGDRNLYERSYDRREHKVGESGGIGVVAIIFYRGTLTVGCASRTVPERRDYFVLVKK